MPAGRSSSRNATFAASVAVLLLLVGYPIIRLALQSVVAGGRLTGENYLFDVVRPGFLLVLFHSLDVSVETTIFATIAGTLLAWAVGRTDLPARKLFRSLLLLPFIIPPFIGALAWQQLLGPAGILSKLYSTLFSASPFWHLYSKGGIVLVMTVHMYPLVYITMLGNLERMNPELEEAAQIAGSRIFRVVRTITVPLMLPAVASGAVLVFISSISNFGIPALLGTPAGYQVLTTRIYEMITLAAEPNSLSHAGALSIILGLVAGAGLVVQRFVLRAKEFSVMSGKSIQPNRVRLGRHVSWISPLLIVFIVLVAFAPVVAIALTALTRAYGLPPLPVNWTLANFHDVLFVNGVVKRAMLNSLLLALGAATATSILGALIAYIVTRTRMKGRYFLDFLSNLPYAIPGTVVAVAMILAWLRPLPFFHFSLYNTFWILLIAYIARYLAFGVRSASASLVQIHASLEEGARISGAGWLRTFRDIVLPLILPGLLSGWFLVFMPSLRELTISALLWSTRHETIGVMVFNLQDAGNTVGSAALATVMILFLFVAHAITTRLTGGRAGI